MEQLRHRLHLERGKKVSVTTVAAEIKGFKYSLKRVVTIPDAAETEALWAERKEFASWFLQSNYQEGKVICLDEMGTSIAMRRFYGRSRVGTPARKRVPKKKAKNFTTIAAIAYGSFVHHKVLNHAANTEEFLTFINELLANLPEPGYTIVMDNVRFHHSQVVKQAIQNAGHTVKYLPPYSPYFNPIEYLFSEWKNFVRMANPSNEEQLIAAVRSVDERIPPEHIRNYFNHVNRNCLRCINNERNFN